MTEQTQSTEQTNTETAEAIESVAVENERSLVGGSSDGDVSIEEIKTEETKEALKEEVKEIVFENFKLPEGVVLDEDFAGKFKDVAKELKLNQEQAQKLVDLQTQFTQGYSAKVDTQFKEQVTAWKNESIAELGPNYKQELTKVAKAMDAFGSPEFRTLLNDTGLGNHKEVVKFFLNIGNKVSEDKMRDGKPSNLGNKSLAEKHYAKSKMN